MVSVVGDRLIWQDHGSTFCCIDFDVPFIKPDIKDLNMGLELFNMMPNNLFLYMMAMSFAYNAKKMPEIRGMSLI